MARLQEFYREKVVPELMKSLELAEPHAGAEASPRSR